MTYIDRDHYQWRFKTLGKLMGLLQRPTVELWLSRDSISFPSWFEITCIIHVHFSCILGFSSTSPSGTTLPSEGRLWARIPPISPTDSRDELTSAARSVSLLFKPLTDCVWKMLLCVASNQKFKSWKDFLLFLVKIGWCNEFWIFIL